MTSLLNFVKTFINKLFLLEQFPRTGKKFPLPEWESYEVRYLIAHKRIKIFYLIQNEKIYVILVWDAKRDSAALENKILCFLKNREE